MNTRLIISLLVGLLTLVLVALATTFFLLRDTTLELAGVQQQQTDSYLLAQELRQSSDDLSRMVRSYVTTNDAEFERRYADIVAIRNGSKARPIDYHHIYWDFVSAGQDKPRPDSDVQKPLVELMREAGFTTQELEKLEEATNRSTQLIALETQAFNAVKGKFQDTTGNYAKLDVPNPTLAQELVFGKTYYQEKASVMQPIEEFFELMEKRTAQQIDAAQSTLTLEQFVFAGLFILALLLIGLIVFFARKQAQARLAEREAAQKRAEAENEQLNDSVINILEAVHALSERDLTAKAPVTEDIIGTVSDSINAFSGATADVLGDVTNTARQVSMVSDTVKRQADAVSETAEHERQSVAQMTESLFEATQTMNQVAALAEQSNESAAQATEVTDQALDTVNATVTDMENIRDTISETEKRIKRLGERSQEISGIVNLINTISERTHALALNASMQAAVAGEAGRGFAVVAEEVQRLAESSRNATEQIAGLVNNIQIETNETINTVNHTIGQVVEGSEQAQKAGEQMRRTKEITALLVDNVRSIANASDLQKEMSAKLLESVQDIGESTEQTAKQIQMQNEGTSALQTAAEKLVESISVFKLPGAGEKPAA